MLLPSPASIFPYRSQGPRPSRVPHGRSCGNPPLCFSRLIVVPFQAMLGLNLLINFS